MNIENLEDSPYFKNLLNKEIGKDEGGKSEMPYRSLQLYTSKNGKRPMAITARMRPTMNNRTAFPALIVPHLQSNRLHGSNYLI